MPPKKHSTSKPLIQSSRKMVDMLFQFLAPTNIKRRLVSDSFWVFGGKVGISLSSILANALLARMLSLEEMGNYFLALSIVSLGATMGTLGLDKSAVRFIAETLSLGETIKTRNVLKKVLSIGSYGTLGVGILYVLSGNFVVERIFNSPILLSVTWLIACWMMAISLQHIFSEIFRGFHDINLASIFGGAVSGGLLLVGLSCMYWLNGKSTLDRVLILTVVCIGLNLLFAAGLLIRRVSALPRTGSDHKMRSLELMSASIAILLTNLTYFAISHADIWIIGVFMSQEDIAVYGAAARLVALLSAPLMIANAVVQPVIAKLYVQGKNGELEDILRSVATIIGISAFLVGVVLLFFGESILTMVYGESYRGAASVMGILCFGQLANVWAGSCGLLLYMTGHHIIAMAATVVTAIATILLSFLLVRTHGILGVAFATTIGFVLLNIVMCVCCTKIVGVKPYMNIPPKFVVNTVS